MTRRLFAYGSLVLPELMHALVGRALPRHDAVLADHARYRVRGAPYPGLVPLVGAETAGVVYDDLGTVDLARIDAYESSLYERRCVRLEDGEAETYVVVPERRDELLPEPWDLEHFARHHLDAYIARVSQR